MNYLQQYILESQVKYPQLFKHPIHVLNHILYTNGNGVEFTNGNLVQIVEFYREIPFSEYYKQVLTRQQILDYHEKFNDHVLEQEYEKQIDAAYCLEPEEEAEIWTQIVNKHKNKYNDVQWVDTFNFSDFFDEIKILNMMNSTDTAYYHYVHLGEGYYDQCLLNEKTDTVLLKIALAMSKAYIMYLQNISEDNFDHERNPFGRRHYKDFNNVRNRSVSLLINDVEKIKGYLFSRSLSVNFRN